MIVAPAIGGVVTDAARDLEAVHVRHVGVEQDEREGRPGRWRPQRAQRGRAAVGDRRPHLPADQQVVHHAPVDRVVVDDQHAADRSGRAASGPRARR